jgi:Mg2+-importing ATPase
VTAAASPSALEPWEEPPGGLLSRLESGERGLAAETAARRLDEVGPNTVAEHRRRSIPVQLLLRFRNPLILLLLGASAVSGLTGDVRSFVVTAVMVLLSVALDFVQEHRADRAAERLRASARVRASVLRDGRVAEIPSTEVVPGDVVLLTAGDLVPADARLLEARDLFVNQALLTGEPYPVPKQAAAAAPAGTTPATLPDLPGAVLMGTSVTSGTGRAVVVRTGARTALGQIGASLERDPPPSAFEQGTRAFGMLILRLALVMVLFVILVNAWRGRPWLQSFLFSVALAVGLTPELLPMVVSVTLSRGALRLSRKKVLVKRLAAIHDLGSMDVLCTDKTGTLTEAHIRLERAIDADERPSPRVLALARLNSWFQSGLKSPLDEAIEAAAQARPDPGLDCGDYSKLDEIPFDFERRLCSVLVRRAAEAPLVAVKGAFEAIIDASASYEAGGPGDVRPLDDARRAALLATAERLGKEGLRVLGVARKELPAQAREADPAVEQELTFAGFLAFEDPPKESARGALASLAELGVTTKVLTGDSDLVARHACAEIGMPVTGVLTGPEIERLDDQALDAAVERTSLFCRVTPAQKNRIILALKRRKHAVGFIGDGINDAPALHSADVGISVDSAVDIAKEAADLILLERDLNVLRDGVVEGRRTLGNIIKYILMGTSSNFGNMFSMAGAAVFLPFLPMLPLQILVNNFLYDLSEIPIPTDTVDEDFIARPRRWDMDLIRKFMMVIGPVSSAFDFLTFYVLLHLFGASESLFQTGWFIESLATQVLVIFVIRTRGNPWRNRPSAALALTSVLVVLVGAVLPFTPLGATLGFVHPPAMYYLVVAATVAAYLATVQIVKGRFYARWAPQVNKRASQSKKRL